MKWNQVWVLQFTVGEVIPGLVKNNRSIKQCSNKCAWKSGLYLTHWNEKNTKSRLSYKEMKALNSKSMINKENIISNANVSFLFS